MSIINCKLWVECRRTVLESRRVHWSSRLAYPGTVLVTHRYCTVQPYLNLRPNLKAGSHAIRLRQAGGWLPLHTGIWVARRTGKIKASSISASASSVCNPRREVQKICVVGNGKTSCSCAGPRGHHHPESFPVFCCCFLLLFERHVLYSIELSRFNMVLSDKYYPCVWCRPSLHL